MVSSFVPFLLYLFFHNLFCSFLLYRRRLILFRSRSLFPFPIWFKVVYLVILGSIHRLIYFLIPLVFSYYIIHVWGSSHLFLPLIYLPLPLFCRSFFIIFVFPYILFTSSLFKNLLFPVFLHHLLSQIVSLYISFSYLC